MATVVDVSLTKTSTLPLAEKANGSDLFYMAQGSPSAGYKSTRIRKDTLFQGHDGTAAALNFGTTRYLQRDLNQSLDISNRDNARIWRTGAAWTQAGTLSLFGIVPAGTNIAFVNNSGLTLDITNGADSPIDFPPDLTALSLPHDEFVWFVEDSNSHKLQIFMRGSVSSFTRLTPSNGAAYDFLAKRSDVDGDYAWQGVNDLPAAGAVNPAEDFALIWSKEAGAHRRIPLASMPGSGGDGGGTPFDDLLNDIAALETPSDTRILYYSSALERMEFLQIGAGLQISEGILSATGTGTGVYDQVDQGEEFTSVPFVPGLDGEARGENTRFTVPGEHLITFSSDPGPDSYGMFQAGPNTRLIIRASEGNEINRGTGPIAVEASGTVTWWRTSANQITIEGHTDETRFLFGDLDLGARELRMDSGHGGDSAMWSPSADAISVRTGGGERVRINNSGLEVLNGALRNVSIVGTVARDAIVDFSGGAIGEVLGVRNDGSLGLIAGGGGGGGDAAPVAIEDEGSQLVAEVARINFVGSGVTATHIGSGAIVVSIPGGGGEGEPGANELADLTDVLTATPTLRHALMGTGTHFASRALLKADISDFGSYLASTAGLTDLANVTLSGVASGQVLGFNGSLWVNRTLGEAGIATADHLHPGVYQPQSANLTQISGLASSAGVMMVGSLGGWVAQSGALLRSSIGVDPAGTDNSTPVTLNQGGFAYMNLVNQHLTMQQIDLATEVKNTLPVARGGTGGTTPTAARTALGVDAAGTDNSVPVTLAGTPTYLTIAGQTITRHQLVRTDVNLVAPEANNLQSLTPRFWVGTTANLPIAPDANTWYATTD